MGSIKTLHMNYFEMPSYVRIWLKKTIENNYKIKMRETEPDKKIDKVTLNEEIEKLFNLNNAGIDIDVFNYMR